MTAVKPKSDHQTAFTWEMDIVNENTLVFRIEWAEPDAISATGIDRDSLRIFLEDTASIPSCQTSDDPASMSRML